jgi:hypothetical protein
MSSLALRGASVLGTVEGSSDEGGKMKTFTQYTVRVESHGGQQWTTAKRYTEFKELEQELELAGIVLSRVKLPKKKLRNTNSVIAKRQQSLQDWLSHAIDQHPDHGILVQFLAPPAPTTDGPAAERAPPPEQFADICALFEELAAAQSAREVAEDDAPGLPTLRQLLARASIPARLDVAIDALQAAAEVGGPLAVGFCRAGGAEDAALLLDMSANLLDRKATEAVEPDSPPVVGALGALRILSLLALDGDWRANNRFIYSGFGCTEPMARSIGAAVGVCIACKRCCSLVRAAYHYMAVAAATPQLVAAFAGEAPQHAVVTNLLLGLLGISEPTSWGDGGRPVGKKKKAKGGAENAEQDGGANPGPDGRPPAPYRAFQVLPVSRLAEETERGAEEAQKALLKMASKGIKSQEQYEKDQEAARLASGTMTVAQRKEAALVDSVLALAALESGCELTRRLLLQLLPPVLCFGLRRIAAEVGAACMDASHAEIPELSARPHASVLEWISAFALRTTRTARCFWTEPHRVELRACCIDQRRRANLATVDAQDVMGAGNAKAAIDQLADRACWNIVQPVYQASVGELVLSGYYVGILLEEAQEQGYSEMKANAETGAAGEEKLLGKAIDCAAQCLIDAPVEELLPEAAAGNALLEELEWPCTQLSPTDVDESLRHVHTLIKLFALVRTRHAWIYFGLTYLLVKSMLCDDHICLFHGGGAMLTANADP